MLNTIGRRRRPCRSGQSHRRQLGIRDRQRPQQYHRYTSYSSRKIEVVSVPLPLAGGPLRKTLKHVEGDSTSPRATCNASSTPALGRLDKENRQTFRRSRLSEKVGSIYDRPHQGRSKRVHSAGIHSGCTRHPPSAVDPLVRF